MTEYDSSPRNDLIGNILEEYSKTGGMDNLPGAVKPLPADYFSGDTFQHFQRLANQAGYKPHWLELQHKIRDEIHKTIALHNAGKKSEVQLNIALINEKIHKFNQSCPPPLQKGSVTVQNLEAAKEHWG